MYTSGTIANSQRLPTKINKNVAISVSGISDTIRHLTIFKIFSNEMPVLLLILHWWYFGYLHMYSGKFFNIYFHEQMFFDLCGKERHRSVFWETITYEQ